MRSFKRDVEIVGGPAHRAAVKLLRFERGGNRPGSNGDGLILLTCHDRCDRNQRQRECSRQPHVSSFDRQGRKPSQDNICSTCRRDDDSLSDLGTILWHAPHAGLRGMVATTQMSPRRRSMPSAIVVVDQMPSGKRMGPCKAFAMEMLVASLRGANLPALRSPGALVHIQ